MLTDNALPAQQTAAQEKIVQDYAARFLLSMGYNDAICTAMEFQLFNVAEELRFMQDDYKAQ